LAIIVEELTLLAQEAESILEGCRETIDDYIAFARSCSTKDKIKQGEKWADKAITQIIEGVGQTDISLIGVAVLLERLHAAGINLLEHNLENMIKEKFSEEMA
jgi:hypothetical protein